MIKYLRYIVKGLAVFIAVFILVYVAVYTYVTINKKSIIGKIGQQVHNKLNGEVEIGDISVGFLNTFPHISVSLENVSIRDTLFNQHHHSFFTGKKVHLNLSITSIIEGNGPVNGVLLENSQLYVYTDSSGFTNKYLFTPEQDIKSATETSTSKVDIETVRLRNVRLILNDEEKLKRYDFDVKKQNCNISTSDSILTIKTSNNILVHSLSFNTAAGSYLKEARVEGNFKISFDKVKKLLAFDNAEVYIKKHPFIISGSFDLSKNKLFSLKVKTKNLNYEFARSVLTEKQSAALSIVKLEKPIREANADISGPLSGGDPLVRANYVCNENNIQSPFVNFSNCSFTGFYTNEVVVGLPRKDPNSRLQFTDFTGTTQNLTIKSKSIYIDNLLFPMVNADIKSDFDLKQLNALLGSSTLDLHQGKGLLDINFSGPLQENNKRNTLINGKCTFSNGVLIYHPTNIEVNNLNGNIVFKNSDVYVNDFRGNAQGSKIIMNGSGKNLLALLKTDPSKMFVDWNIYSPSLNLGSFTSLLRQRVAAKKTRKTRSRIGQNLDQIINQANFHLNLKADQLIYKRFKATKASASLGLMNQNWTLNNVSLSQGGGSMVISGELNQKNRRYYEANIKANIQNVDINKVFYAFDNFGQQGISSENLRGKLSSRVDVKMDLDRELAAPPINMDGTIDFLLKKGALLHYPPLQKIGDIAFKNRNFDEVYFAELKDRFDIRDREIIINRMLIESTVVTLFIEGVYSMRGKSDLSIQVPLSNLKKRDEEYKLKNKGGDAKAGASVYIRGTPDEDGNIKFKLDLFRKFRKSAVEKRKEKNSGEKARKDNPDKKPKD